MDNTLIMGLLIFLARVLDVTIGTIRTISIVHGRSWTAFFLGFVEVTMWLAVVSIVVPLVNEKPILVLFYALGFSTGNIVGISVEKRLLLGDGVLQLYSQQNGSMIANAIRAADFPATVFEGKGKEGDISAIYSVGPRKRLEKALRIAQRIEPDIFYVTTSTGSIRRLKGSIVTRPTGWRAILKRK
jgi:uncharacterized protein YebE (UPF0316 family)